LWVSALIVSGSCEVVALNPQQFTSTVQMLMCCSNVGLHWQTRNRSTVLEQNGGLIPLLALEQSGGRTGALLSKNIDRTAKSLYALLERYTAQRQAPSTKSTHEILPSLGQLWILDPKSQAIYRL
jgi:hypothetical protein